MLGNAVAASKRSLVIGNNVSRESHCFADVCMALPRGSLYLRRIPRKFYMSIDVVYRTSLLWPRGMQVIGSGFDELRCLLRWR